MTQRSPWPPSAPLAARCLEAAGKEINECLVVLRAAAGRLAPDAQTRVIARHIGLRRS
jgi:hypothetical protein